MIVGSAIMMRQLIALVIMNETIIYINFKKCYSYTLNKAIAKVQWNSLAQLNCNQTISTYHTHNIFFQITPSEDCMKVQITPIIFFQITPSEDHMNVHITPTNIFFKSHLLRIVWKYKSNPQFFFQITPSEDHMKVQITPTILF